MGHMTRAERRRTQRIERKQAKRQDKEQGKRGAEELGSPPKQRFLVLALFLILFSFTGLSFVVGADVWLGGEWISILGWVGIVLSFGGGVFLWFKQHHNFYSAKWGRYIFFIIFFGIALGFLYTYSIGVAIENLRWEKTKTSHPYLMKTVYSWSYGERFGPQQCQKASKAQDIFIRHLWASDTPPSSKQVDLAVYVERVLYQSGCPNRFVLLEGLGKKGNPVWSTKHPLRDKEVRMYLNQFWPNSYDGCHLEQVRLLALGKIGGDCSKWDPEDPKEWDGFKKN